MYNKLLHYRLDPVLTWVILLRDLLEVSCEKIIVDACFVIEVSDNRKLLQGDIFITVWN